MGLNTQVKSLGRVPPGTGNGLKERQDVGLLGPTGPLMPSRPRITERDSFSLNPTLPISSNASTSATRLSIFLLLNHVTNTCIALIAGSLVYQGDTTNTRSRLSFPATTTGCATETVP
jgi:hypothetical protein